VNKEIAMLRKKGWTITTAVSVAFTGALLVWAEDQERRVQEGEVPPAALAALKQLSGGAALTEFSEEIEHGSKFYEGSWKGPDGNVDGLVTEAGDVVEIEESIPAEKVPATVRTAIEKEAGQGATIHYEKKTFIAYEAHFKKDGKGHEVLLTPDGRRAHEGGDGDEDEDDEDEDD